MGFTVNTRCNVCSGEGKLLVNTRRQKKQFNEFCLQYDLDAAIPLDGDFDPDLSAFWPGGSASEEDWDPS